MATNDSPYNDSNGVKDTPNGECDVHSVYENHIVMQQIERFTEEYRNKNGGQYPLLQNGYTQPEPYCVYVLECDAPNLIETVNQRMTDKRGYTSKKMHAAHHSWKRFYVGATSDIYSRLLSHLDGDGALFTSVFPPIELREVNWHDSYQEAESEEESVAVEYQRKYPDAFIWQN